VAALRPLAVQHVEQMFRGELSDFMGIHAHRGERGVNLFGYLEIVEARYGKLVRYRNAEFFRFAQHAKRDVIVAADKSSRAFARRLPDGAQTAAPECDCGFPLAHVFGSHREAMAFERRADAGDARLHPVVVARRLNAHRE
jgi:hypothetical protein